MAMFPNLSGSLQSYMANLDRTQNMLTQSQSEVSSGYKVQQASDNPAAVDGILQLVADLAQNQQVQTNLGLAGSELNTADSALQSAVQAVQSAVSIAAQGANSTADATERANLAQQVSGLQQTLVGISQTTVNGRYIFSGDQDAQPSYQLDPTQPEGVMQLTSSASTRVIQDATGMPIAVAKTAQEIFDAKNPDGTAATGNVFAAVNSLLTALQNNDQAGIANAATSLKSAGAYLNDQLAFYGEAEDRVTSATTLAQKFQTQEQASLSQLRDADIPTVAIQLSQLQVQQQATLSVEAQIEQQKNLFSYLG
jgi:flagellar hook-associated protein 3 FlgL